VRLNNDFLYPSLKAILKLLETNSKYILIQMRIYEKIVGLCDNGSVQGAEFFLRS
jgi:hypothetical protein